MADLVVGVTAVSPPGDFPVALREDVEDYLRGLEFLADHGCQGLTEAMHYALLSGGKRVRPVLALATARSIGMDHRRVLPLAAALELIHCCSLVHDDLPAMDDDDLRRGRPATHRVFGEGVAILAGDALFAEAFRLLLSVEGPPDRALVAARVVVDALAANGLAGGQYIDITGSAGDEAAVLGGHRLKTGRLLEASVGSVLELAAAPAGVAGSLGRYAAELGRLFQIVDDILDVTGSQHEIGRQGGSDIRNGRRTVVTSGGVGRAVELADDCMARIAKSLAAAACETSELLGIAEYVRAHAR